MNEKVNRRVDSAMLILTLTLVIVGLVMMFSASYPWAIQKMGDPYYYVKRQGFFAIGGVIAMIAVSIIPYKTYHILSWPFYWFSVIVLVYVLVGGIGEKGAVRWVNIAGIGFQPSEVAKASIIILISSLITRNQKKIKTFKHGIVIPLAYTGIVCLLTLLQPHFSATVIIICTAVSIIFVGGARFLYLGGMGVTGIVGACVLAISQPYRLARLEVWLDPFIDPTGGGWQAAQSFIAIGSGGLFGLGFGQSRQKYLFLPEPANDFIFAVISEELGFFGVLVIISLFAMFIFRGYIIAFRSKDKFSMLLAVGIMTKFTLQTVLNLAVISGLAPVTGASLPFFSYGGTALLMQLAEIGILLNISRFNRGK